MDEGKPQIEAWLEEGLGFYSQGDPARALEAWQKILDADPGHGLAQQYVAYVRQVYHLEAAPLAPAVPAAEEGAPPQQSAASQTLSVPVVAAAEENFSLEESPPAPSTPATASVSEPPVEAAAPPAPPATIAAPDVPAPPPPSTEAPRTEEIAALIPSEARRGPVGHDGASSWMDLVDSAFDVAVSAPGVTPPPAVKATAKHREENPWRPKRAGESTKVPVIEVAAPASPSAPVAEAARPDVTFAEPTVSYRPAPAAASSADVAPVAALPVAAPPVVAPPVAAPPVAAPPVAAPPVAAPPVAAPPVAAPPVAAPPVAAPPVVAPHLPASIVEPPPAPSAVAPARDELSIDVSFEAEAETAPVPPPAKPEGDAGLDVHVDFGDDSQPGEPPPETTPAWGITFPAPPPTEPLASASSSSAPLPPTQPIAGEVRPTLSDEGVTEHPIAPFVRTPSPPSLLHQPREEPDPWEVHAPKSGGALGPAAIAHGAPWGARTPPPVAPDFDPWQGDSAPPASPPNPWLSAAPPRIDVPSTQEVLLSSVPNVGLTPPPIAAAQVAQPAPPPAPPPVAAWKRNAVEEFGAYRMTPGGQSEAALVSPARTPGPSFIQPPHGAVEERVARSSRRFDSYGDPPAPPASADVLTVGGPPAAAVSAPTASPPAPTLPLAPPSPPPPSLAPSIDSGSPWDDGPGAVLDLDVQTQESPFEDLVRGAPPSAPTPPPQVAAPLDENEELMRGARELFALGDFSGSLDLIDKVLKKDATHEGALAYLKRNEATLLKMYESKLGGLAKAPRQLMPPDEVIWINMHHKAGFILAQVDGALTYEDILEISGMPRFDTMRILHDLVQQGVIG